MKKEGLMIFFMLIIFINLVSASCSEGQIDVNSASLEELDLIYGIGVAKAQAIVDARPFGTIDDLIDVNGIGEITLNKIKEQDLACVGGEETSYEDKDEIIEEVPKTTQEKEEQSIEEKFEETEPSKEQPILVKEQEKKNEPLTLQTISLNSKDIKSEDVTDLTTKYSIYGLLGFLVLVVCLFVLKNKKYNKNEFA